MTRRSTATIAALVVLSLLTLVGGYLVGDLWWYRLSDRLVGDPDAEGTLLFVALAAAGVAGLELLIAAIAVITKTVNAWWLAAPSLLLAATVFGLCGVDLGRV